jgi:hypothetical protein
MTAFYNFIMRMQGNRLSETYTHELTLSNINLF